MRNSFLAAILWLAVTTVSYAGNILYVDTVPAESGSGWDGTNGHSYTGTPGAGTGYGTVNAAIAAAGAGDDIYLRGGSYTETSGDGAFALPPSGTSGDWTSIQSYPGEWAILDAGNPFEAAGAEFVIGATCYNNACPGDYCREYIRFERLEITGSRKSGIWLNRGPFIIRYCYIHDNGQISSTDNPAGIHIIRSHGAIIEYNVFDDNGALTPDTNCSHITFYADQAVTIPSCNDAHFLANGVCDPDDIIRENIVRYNVFRNTNGYAEHSFSHKAGQVIQPRAAASTISETYKGYGDKIHHNLVIGDISIKLQQDFAQAYNNIVPDSSIEVGYRIAFAIDFEAVYNNLSETLEFGACEPSESYYFWATSDVIRQRGWVYNNIVTGYTSGSNWRDVSFVAGSYASNYDSFAASTAHDLDDFYMKNNYIYAPTNADTVFNTLLPDDANAGSVTLVEFEEDYANIENNYQKASSEGGDNLLTGATGADQYIPRGAHVVSGSTTIANAGVGISHPYLSGVTIPSYIGPVDPVSTGWVSVLYAMDDTYLAGRTGQGDAAYDETWIGGTGSSRFGSGSGSMSIGGGGGAATFR